MRSTLNTKIMVGISVLLTLAMTWHLVRRGMHHDFDEAQWGVVGGDPSRGEAAIELHECASCHRIAGIRASQGKEGPDLTDFRRQMFIVDTLANTPEELVTWLQDHGAMVSTNTQATEQEARDMAAYLLWVE